MSSPPESITDIDEIALNKKRGRAQSVEPAPLQELDSENFSSEETASTTVSAPKKTKRDDEDLNNTTTSTTVNTIRKNMKDMTTTDNNPSESKSTATSISQDEDDEPMGAITKEEDSLATKFGGGDVNNHDDWGEFAQDDDEQEEEKEAQKDTAVGEDEKPKYTFGASSGFGTKGWTATHQTIPTPSKQPTFGGFGSASGFGGFASSSNNSPGEKKESTSVPTFGSFAKATASPFATAAAAGNSFTTTSSSTTHASESSISTFNNCLGTATTAAVEFVGRHKTESEEQEQDCNGDIAATATFGEGAKVKNSGVRQAEIMTGEEDEETIYQIKAKLLVMDTASSTWKERGEGTFRINRSEEDAKKTRLVMRTDSVYRVVLNLLLFPGMKVFIMQDKFVRFAGFEAETKEEGISEPKLVNFALKLSKPDLANEVCEKIISYIPPSSDDNLH